MTKTYSNNCTMINSFTLMTVNDTYKSYPNVNI